ncbi:pyroglutamyl-peptidase 1 isoform X1 [Lepisosteus oculatus]|uniref:pyroglutamyl-peptidase 1 isoform X1 n=2 Tax=Lepisosteus oculatus TaxID=7918 RepID=UPI0037178893
MGTEDKVVVVVTGFGPFRQYLFNPSWPAVQGLKMSGLGEDVDIHIKELPVSYRKAQELVVLLWKTFSPQLAIHVGIAPGSSAIILEQSGKNEGYKSRDVCGTCPADGRCVVGGPGRIDSVMDMKSLARRLRGRGLDVIYSRDAGRGLITHLIHKDAELENTLSYHLIILYLCDFVYYTSLYQGKGRAALVHVPASGRLASTQTLVPILRDIAHALLQQLQGAAGSEERLKTDAVETSGASVVKL